MRFRPGAGHPVGTHPKKGFGPMPKKRNGGSRETLTGVITPVKWEGDEITEVALSATDDEEYHIENSDKFIELIQAFIEATGDVHRSKKSFKSINIKKFRIV
jgi:hypothetical protein